MNTEEKDGDNPGRMDEEVLNVDQNELVKEADSTIHEDGICRIGALFTEENWICSEDLILMSSLEKKDFYNHKYAFHETIEEFTLQKTDYVCRECLNTFGSRRYKSCGHPDHQGSTKQRNPKNLTYITAKSYFRTFRKINMLPNQAICNNPSCSIDIKLEDYKPEEPPCKKKLLGTLNNLMTQMTPSVQQKDFNKRNLLGQSKLVKETLDVVNQAFTEGFEVAGLPVSTAQDTSQLEKDSADLKWIITNIKARIEECTPAEKKSILTLIPPTWTIARITRTFGVSDRVAKGSRKLLKATGTVLPPTKPKQGKKINIKTKQTVLQFYYQDSVSRACAGMKDVVSVKNPDTGKRQHKQKRYLLHNLKELHSMFMHDHPNIKIGQTSFMQLRPKECLSYASKGHHNVCLCVYHQNVKLLFNAIKISSMKPFIQAFVCSTENKDCHYRRCPNCLSKKKDVEALIRQSSPIISEQSVIKYRRWISTDGTQFVNAEKPTDEFLKFTIDELESLLKHHFISKHQQARMDQQKTNLKDGEAIIQVDFAENLDPQIQDAIQSEYFMHKGITLHPITVYWKQGDQVKYHGYCVLSDCTVHDTNTVFGFFKRFIPQLKNDFVQRGTNLERIFYWSDGCAAQYKNRKNFCNLFYHQTDFGVPAEWNFFATAHGKGPCDAIGGTTKRQARIAALQGTKITTCTELFEWCSRNIQGVTYLLVTDDEVQKAVEDNNLSQRYEDLSTIAGTQQAHRIAIENGRVNLYQISQDHTPMASRAIKSYVPPVSIDDCSISDWIGCVYDNKWYLARVEDIEHEDQELMVTYWKINSGSKGGKSFVPESSRNCYVPIGNVLKKLAPARASRSTRFVELTLEDQTSMDNLLQIYLKQH